MKISVIDINIENNRNILNNCWDKNWKHKPEYIELINHPNNVHDAIEYYKQYGSKDRPGFVLVKIDDPKTIIEHLIDRVYFDHGYENYRNSFPEDMTESRTDWDDMKSYADELANFVDTLTNLLDEEL